VPVALVVPDGTDPAADGEAGLQRLRSLGVEVFAGPCRFLDPRRLQVREVTLRPRRFVLATPSHTVPPQIAGLADLDTPAIATGSAFLAIGQGRRALEAACKARQAGAEVTLLTQGGLLPDFDPDSVRLLRIHLERTGIAVIDAPLLEGGAIIPASGTGRGARRRHKLVTADGAASFEFDRLFVEGRAESFPEDIAPTNAGILGREGRLILDKALTTTNRRVLAVGAASGDPDHAVNRSAQVGTALASLLFRRGSTNYPMLAVRFCPSSPAVTEIGLREDTLKPEARGHHRFHRVRLDGGGNQGAIKVITNRKGIILGASIVGEHPLELIPVFQLAMAREIRLEDLAGIPLPSASHAAAIGEVSRLALRDRLLTPGTGRLLRFLRVLG
ncbi:MAG TPA: hypothetical protein PKW21_14475, partial [Rhabdaerophilum sp.]|nr:hypothetical protein [Rhabdaerophilum sp.]